MTLSLIHLSSPDVAMPAAVATCDGTDFSLIAVTVVVVFVALTFSRYFATVFLLLSPVVRCAGRELIYSMRATRLDNDEITLGTIPTID